MNPRGKEDDPTVASEIENLLTRKATTSSLLISSLKVDIVTAAAGTDHQNPVLVFRPVSPCACAAVAVLPRFVWTQMR